MVNSKFEASEQMLHGGVLIVDDASGCESFGMVHVLLGQTSHRQGSRLVYITIISLLSSWPSGYTNRTEH